MTIPLWGGREGGVNHEGLPYNRFRITMDGVLELAAGEESIALLLQLDVRQVCRRVHVFGGHPEDSC